MSSEKRRIDASDVLVAAGAVILAVGVALFSVPAAVCVGGLTMIACGLVLAHTPKKG